MTTKPAEVREYVFDPGLISTLAVQSVQQERMHPGHLKTGIPQLDDHFVMLRPRRVVGIEADTSHGKTSVMNILARNVIQQISGNEIAVYATWEDSVEDFGLAALANATRIALPSLFHGEINEEEWAELLKAAAARAAQPLWAIGHSEQAGARRPRLTMTDLWRAMEYIVDIQKRQVRIVFLDYLQRINYDDMKSEDRRGGFIGIMDKIKDLALAFNCCCVIGSQVSRDVADRKWKMPLMHDALETSNFEQTCDGMLALWIPAKTEKVGDLLINGKGQEQPGVYVTDNLMLIQTNKQKKGQAPVLRAVSFIPQTNEIRSYT